MRFPATGSAAGPRRLRCARCAHEWTVDPAQASPPPVDPPAPADPPPFAEPPPLTADAPPLWANAPPLVAAARRRAAARHAGDDDADDWDQPRTGTRDPVFDRAAAAAWTASIVLLVAVAVAAVQFRAEIMRAWPPSQRLYALFDATPQ